MDKGLLKRALEDTEDPTPGYMFRDIAQWTFIDHNTQTKLIAFLMDKLKPSGSVHVLAKTLRVIKVLCETGHADFQREMQRRNEELKQYAAYRGKPDAKYGDKLNEKVRTSAREAIDSAFSHRKETKVQVSQGHGSDSTYEEKGTTFTTGVRVTETNGWTNSSNTATSNAHMAPMPTTNKWAEHMAQAASGKGGAPGAAPGVVSSFVDAAKTGFGLWHENIKTTEQLVMESMTTNSDFRPVEVHGFGHTPSAGGAAGGWKFAEEGTAGGSTVRQETTKILTPFQAEVERVCNFKNTPQRVELTQFVAGIEGIMERRGSSDLEELAEVLDEHLQQKQSWQHRLNAMAAIEAVLRHPDLEGKDTLEQYFKENPEDVQRNVHVVQSSLKEKAQKVLKLLGVPERMKGQVETSHAPAQQISVATGNGGISWNAAPAPTAEPTNDTAGGSDIMGGMVVKSRAKQAPEDKNKLRKRAAMKVEDDEEPPVVEQRQQTRPPATQQQSARPTQQPAQDNGWGSWGDNGSTANTWEFDAPAQAQQQSAPPPAPSSNKGKDALDDFFGGPSNAWGGSLPASQPPVPQPVPVAQPVPVVQQPTVAAQQPTVAAQQPTVAAQQPTVAAQQPPNGINMQMVMQMQQQLQMMLTQINMSDPNAVAQMQALMAQQQQLMAMVTAGAAPAAPAPEVNTPSSPVAPHSTFSLPTPAPRQAQKGGDAFASVQQEMMSKLMRPQQ